ncbi:MAG: hypothetical protein PVH00_12960, partial [Gemmatimonadota bacterium]
ETDAPPPPDRETMAMDSLLAELRDLDEARANEPSDRALALRRVGALYLIGVHEEWAVKEGLAALDSLPLESPADSALPLAYRGALRVLKGKHAFWPHSKVGHVRRGLSALDRAVDMAPGSARVRYLRLLSGYYLPGLFRRGDEVREDLAALAVLLPDARAELPPNLLVEITRFVLENGDVSGPERAELRKLVSPAPADVVGTDAG